MTAPCAVRASRRAFALPVVLLLLLVVSLSLSAALTRFDVQQRAVQRQIAEYRMHHEMFGARAIALQWLERTRITELKSSADNDEIAFGFTIPGGTQMRAYIYDGQGTATYLVTGLDDETRDYYDVVLGRISDRPDLVREAGPPQISLNAAPPDLVRAVFGDDLDRAADRLLRQRDRDPLGRTDITESLQIAGATPEQLRMITAITTTDPLIWRIRIETDDGLMPREFEMLVEYRESKPMMLAWRELFADPEDDGIAGEDGTDRGSGASRRRRSR